MNSTLEALEDNLVKLSVTIPEADLEPELDAAYKRISKEIRMPGFRPGKVPRKLLEQRLGPAVAREEAMRTALPGYYSQAVIDNHVDVIASPDIEITGGEEAGDVTFDAVVEIRPTVTIGGYDSLTVEIPSPAVTDEDIEERLDSLRRQHSELAVADRPAAEHDHVTIDIAGTIDGEAVPGLTAEDYDYIVGSGAVVAEIDENLTGASAGDTVEFSAPHPDENEESEIEFAITVKDVQEPVLPEVDDDFAREASEFETLAELRADIAEQLATTKRRQSAMALDQNTGEALAELVTDELSDALVENEMDERAQDMAMRLQAQGLGIEQFLQITGQTPEMFREGLREQALISARVDLALRAIVTSEALDVSEDELDEEVMILATQLDQPLADVKEQLIANGRLDGIRSDMQIRKAMEFVTERSSIVDEDGNAVDRDLLEEPEDDHDHDHGSEEE